MAVEQWSWLGDHLALDFANTVRRRGMRYVELITSAAELEVWLDHESGRVPVEAEVDDDLVTEFVGARDHALELLRAAATHRSLPATDVTAVNHLVLAAPAIRLLGAHTDDVVVHSVGEADPPTRLLGSLATAVVELLSGPELETLALCDAPGCGQLYLRGRPNQQWCNPHCGTRARSERHADRERSTKVR